jgi:hypothetical protein
VIIAAAAAAAAPAAPAATAQLLRQVAASFVAPLVLLTYPLLISPAVFLWRVWLFAARNVRANIWHGKGVKW